jgi:hypothetical protein
MMSVRLQERVDLIIVKDRNDTFRYCVRLWRPGCATRVTEHRLPSAHSDGNSKTAERFTRPEIAASVTLRPFNG